MRRPHPTHYSVVKERWSARSLDALSSEVRLVAPTHGDDLVEHPRHLREERRPPFCRRELRLLNSGKHVIARHVSLADRRRERR